MNIKKTTLLAAVSLFSCFVVAQDNTAPTVTVKLPQTAKAGKVVSGVVTLTFAEGLHGYQNPPSNENLIPVSITIASKGAKLKSVKYPAGKDEAVGGEPKPVRVYEGSVKIPVTVTLPKIHGKVKLSFAVHYQQCNAQSCYPPADLSAEATINVK